MKGLLLKDWYMTLKCGKSFLWFPVLYAVIAAFSGINYTLMFMVLNVFFGSMLVKTLMAYEEQNKWDSLAVNLPVTAGQLVVEKYLVGFGGAMFSNVITFLIFGVMRMASHRHGELQLGPLFILFIAWGALFVAVELPVLFKYGTAKARILQLMVYGIAAAIAAAVSTALLEPLAEQSLGWKSGADITYEIAVIIMVLAGLIFAGSIWLSVRIYQKKDF